MIAPTHITFAEFVYLLLLTTTGVALNAVNAAVIAVASVLPDVDTAASFIGRAFPFLSKRIERRFGHRTLTHSAVFVGGLAILLFPLSVFVPDVYVCLLIGYASHPFLDTMTVHGVKLFYPFSTVKCVFPLEVNNPHRYRLQTGSKMDKALSLLFFIGCIPTFLIAHQGYERFIRSTQKNIESAVRDYNEFSKTHFVFAELVAYNMMTKERIEGTFEIVGTLNPTTILFRGKDGALHSLGREYETEYVAERIMCRKGDPAETIVRSVDMSNQLLAQISTYLDFRFETHLFGALSSSDPFSVPQESKTFNPIVGSFNTIRFNYATYEDIQRLNLENIFITKGALTIRTVKPKAFLPTQVRVDSTLQAQAINGIEAVASFAQISFQIDPKENIEFFHQKGDTVREKDILIKRDLALFYDQQIALNLQKITALEEDREFKLAEIEQKLSQAKLRMDNDSLNLAHTQRQYENGYATELTLDQSRLKYSDSRQAYAHLLSAKNRIQTKFAIDIQKLKNDIAMLRSKEKAAAKQSEIRSTTSGIVHDIRQLYHNNKLQVTFVIRRLETKR
ncbi:MAG TPA: metal-dependent hydrolase [Bacteroidota bacterium]|nr:metal-dependent hydrolase [Bacteroidota bacterium]